MDDNTVGAHFEFDIEDLKKGLKEAKQSISLTTSEFQKSTSGLNSWQKTAVGLTAKISELTANLGKQNDVVKNLEMQYEIIKDQYGENSAESQKLLAQLNKEEAKYSSMQKQLTNYQGRLDKLRASEDSLTDTLSKSSTVAKKATDEFKDTTKTMVDWRSNAEGLTAKIKQLNTIVSEQESLVDKLAKEYSDLVKQENYSEEAARALQNEWKSQNGILTSLKNDTNKYENALDDLTGATKDLDNANSILSNGYSVMKNVTANLISDGINKIIDISVEAVKKMITVGVEFEQTMSKVAAISGATKDELKALTDKAEEMGAKTKFSANEAAQAFNYMAMAGWKTSDMLDGIEGIMNLAAASGEDLALVSDIVTDALTAFGLSAKDSTRFADVLAQASSNANTTVGAMGYTFQYVAPVAGALGYSIEDTAVAIGLMANAGIKGEKSGTALRAIFSRMAAPTDDVTYAMKELGVEITNSDGSMKDLDDVMIQLRKGFNGLSQEQQVNIAKSLAGTEAMSGLLAIVNASDSDFQKLTTSINNSSGAADEMASIMMDNLGGSFEEFTGALETSGIAIYKEFKQPLQDAFKTGTKEISTLQKTLSSSTIKSDIKKIGDGFGKLIDETIKLGAEAIPKLIKALAFVSENGETIIDVMKILTISFVTYNATVKLSNLLLNENKVSTVGLTLANTLFTKGVGATTIAFGALNATMKANVIGLVATAVSGLVAGTVILISKMKEKQEVTYKEIEADKKQIEAIKEQKDSIKELEDAKAEQIANGNAEIDHVSRLKDELLTLVDTNGKVKDGYEARANFILNELNEALGTELNMNDLSKQSIDEISASIDNLIIKQKAKIQLQAGEEAYTTAIQNQTKANNDLRKANDDLQEAEWNRDRALYVLQATIETGTQKEVDAAKKKSEAAQLEYDNKKKIYDGLDSTVKTYNENIADYEYLSGLVTKGNTEKLQEELNKRASSYQENGKTVKLSIDDDILNEQYALTEKKKLYDQDVKNGADKETSKYKNQVESSNQRLKQLAQELSDQTSTTEKMTPEIVNAWQKLATGSKDIFDEQMDKLSPEQKQRIMEQAGIVEKDGQYVIGNYDKMGGDSVATIQGQNASFQAASEGNVDSVEDGILTRFPGVTGTMAKLGVALIKGIKDAKDDNGDTPEDAGKNFLEGIGKGLGNWAIQETLLGKVFSFGKSLVKKLKEGTDEHSPSKATRKIGQFFMQGFGLGLDDEEDGLLSQVSNLGKEAISSFSNSLQDDISGIKASVNTSFNNGSLNGNASNSKSLGSVVNNFYQTNNSPKALSQLEIYRQTHNLLNRPGGA